VSQRNDNDVARYNFNARRTSTDFGNFSQRCCWQSMLSKGDLWFVIPPLL